MANTKISSLTAATTPLAGTEILPIVQSSTTKNVSVANLTAGRDITTKNIASGTIGTPTQGSFAMQNTIARFRERDSIDSFAWTTNINDSGVQDNSGMASWKTQQGYGNAGSLDLWRIARAPAGSSTFTNFVTVDNAGNVTFNANNLIQGTAAKGINFTANSAAAGMTSQLLNWYEEGTWTPTVTAFSGTITTVGTVSGQYTRIGRQIFYSADCTITTNGTGAVTVKISGMPYTAGGTLRYVGCGEDLKTGKSLIVDYYTGSTYFGVNFYDGTYPGADGARLIISIVFNM